MSSSPFLETPVEQWTASNALTFAVLDGFPVSPGHTLVITKRLVATWFEASAEEQAAVMALVNEVKATLDARLAPKPTGYNVGFNSGESAGQTVMHLHVHVIPRYSGDMDDPRGGVRHVIPEKGNYLRSSQSRDSQQSNPAEPDNMLRLSTGHPNSRLWDQLSARMAGAKTIDILVSFVQLSGLDVIKERLFESLSREAAIRILVSDYLYISDPQALRRLLGWSEANEAEEQHTGLLTIRLIELAKLASKPASFHPKSWRIVDEHGGFIAVGSSNLSRPALETGIEWNLLSSSRGTLGAHAEFAEEFNNLWNVASELTSSLIENYAEQTRKFRAEHFEPECLDSRVIPQPRPWQITALESLHNIRLAGYQRALVAVATGMGKTWLSAFDARQVGQSLNKRPRVLVIAHRSHILAQAEAALSVILDAEFGEGRTAWYLGDRSDLDGDIVIASIQKLSRPQGLERLAEEQFDYAIIDEVHHAHAPTYRRVLAQIDSHFTLGLTATPERSDGVDVASIFDDNLAHHATVGDGIAEDSLVPFHYVGIKDTVDFRQVPWRNGRFDLAELERRVEQSDRMERLWRAMQDHPAERTIVFCCSRRHALFARDWLRSRGVSSAAVFSGGGGDSYAESLESLRSGKLQTMCVVDMFNEGLDIPAVDRVIMLRPTESKVVFLQQLGRGLRASEGKTRLLVIDFVGNHRIFAQRIIHLLSLQSKEASWNDLKSWLDGEPPELPEGCLLDVELEARDVLREFLPRGAQAGIEAYRAMRDELGRRPAASELLARGILPKTLSKKEGSWFAFVDSEGDLSEDEQNTMKLFHSWLKTLETSSLNKSYKMVVLRVLLDQGQLFAPVDLHTFAQQCRSFMRNHPVLRRDLEGDGHAVDHQAADQKKWTEWWIKWPIDRWLDTQNGHKWFERVVDNFQLTIDCTESLRPTLESLTEELVDWRLAAYSKTHRLVETEIGEVAFEAKVSHAGGRPILFLPDKTINPDRPVGPVNVQLPDGTIWEFKFVKVACNVAKPLGGTKNELGQLLKTWFGPNAGLPGTDFKVHFSTQQGQWHAQPSILRESSQPEANPTAGSVTRELQSETNAPAQIETEVERSAKYKTHVPVYDLVAAAGFWGEEGVPEEIGWLEISDRKLTPGMFAAQVVGRSMEPKIPSGSWCLFTPCPQGSRQGRLLLVQVNTHTDPEDGGRYTIKRYHSTKAITDEGWQHNHIELQPLNPDFEPIAISEDEANDLRVIGEFISLITE